MSDPTYTDAQAGPTSDERNWAVLAHLGPLIVGIFSVGTAGWLVPLVIWLVKGDESAFVRDQAKEALNFHISMFLGTVAGYILFFTLILSPVALLLWLCIWVGGIVFAILAAIEVNKGRRYRYPLILRILA